MNTCVQWVESSLFSEERGHRFFCTWLYLCLNVFVFVLDYICTWKAACFRRMHEVTDIADQCQDTPEECFLHCTVLYSIVRIHQDTPHKIHQDTSHKIHQDTPHNMHQDVYTYVQYTWPECFLLKTLHCSIVRRMHWWQSCEMSQIWQIYLCKFFGGLG